MADVRVEAANEEKAKRLVDFDDTAIAWRRDDEGITFVDVEDLTPLPEDASQSEKMLHHLASVFRADRNRPPQTVEELEAWAFRQRTCP
jgi:hypothetical protein